MMTPEQIKEERKQTEQIQAELKEERIKLVDALFKVTNLTQDLIAINQWESVAAMGEVGKRLDKRLFDSRRDDMSLRRDLNLHLRYMDAFKGLQ